MPQLSINDDLFWKVKKRMVELKMTKYDEIVSHWLEHDIVLKMVDNKKIGLSTGIKCFKCGHEIKELTNVCPNCGHYWNDVTCNVMEGGEE